MDDIDIAARLKRLRKDKKMTQAKLAAAAGVSTGTIGNIESGTRDYGASVVGIARALGTTPEYLQMDQHQAPAQDAPGLTKDALTIAAIFDWLKDRDDREEVRYILTQAVIERQQRSHHGPGDPEPPSPPTSKPNPTGSGRKQRA